MTGMFRTLALLAWGVMTAWPSLSAAPTSLESQVSAIEWQGRSRPRDAVQALARLLPTTKAFSAEQLEVLTASALLLNRFEPEAAEATARGLDGWTRSPVAAAAAAAATLVRAHRILLHGNAHEADALVTQAMIRLPADSPPFMRMRFLVVQAISKHKSDKVHDALRIAHEAMRMADASGDVWRGVTVRQNLAAFYLVINQVDRARNMHLEVVQMAAPHRDARVIAWSHGFERWMRALEGDLDGERRELRLAIDAARRHGDRGDEAFYLANLGLSYLRGGQNELALSLTEQALALMREPEDRSFENWVLLSVGKAHIASRNFAAGRRFIDRAIAIDEMRGSVLGAAQLLRELGDQLEKAGDLAGAVNAYHRLRTLEARIRWKERERVIVDTQERFDAERRAQSLAALRAENELKGEQLRQRELRLMLLALLAAVFLLSFIGLLVLYRGVRRTNRALESSTRQLEVLSGQDALTGLANRRHFQAAVRTFVGAGGLSGSLFLIDIDRFKSLNDTHGHAAGDAVLAEVACRLRAIATDGGLLVRWGGEEFLVLTPALEALQAHALAERLLLAIGGAPIDRQGASIQVTASIGYATFPHDGRAASWEAAVDLVDKAMYLAKAGGRNRACGVEPLHAADATTLAHIARSLAAASHEGRVRLTVLDGPRQSPPPSHDLAPVPSKA